MLQRKLNTGLDGAGGGERGKPPLDGGGRDRGEAVWRVHGRGQVLVGHLLGHGVLLTDHSC